MARTFGAKSGSPCDFLVFVLMDGKGRSQPERMRTRKREDEKTGVQLRKNRQVI